MGRPSETEELAGLSQRGDETLDVLSGMPIILDETDQRVVALDRGIAEDRYREALVAEELADVLGNQILPDEHREDVRTAVVEPEALLQQPLARPVHLRQVVVYALGLSVELLEDVGRRGRGRWLHGRGEERRARQGLEWLHVFTWATDGASLETNGLGE